MQQNTILEDGAEVCMHCRETAAETGGRPIAAVQTSEPDSSNSQTSEPDSPVWGQHFFCCFHKCWRWAMSCFSWIPSLNPIVGKFNYQICPFVGPLGTTLLGPPFMQWNSKRLLLVHFRIFIIWHWAHSGLAWLPIHSLHTSRRWKEKIKRRSLERRGWSRAYAW